jgi:hypothetical protein
MYKKSFTGCKSTKNQKLTIAGAERARLSVKYKFFIMAVRFVSGFWVKGKTPPKSSPWGRT